MVHKIYCATRFGLYASIVEVEASFTRALPAFVISGLASNAIQESKQRVQSALVACGFSFPPLKITINLSPSDLPKYGSHFDLPIALLVGMQKCLKELENRWFAFGELGLDGMLKHSDVLFGLVLDVLLQEPDACMILPYESREFFSFVPNLRCVYAHDLKEALEILQADEIPEQNLQNLNFPYFEVLGQKYFYPREFGLDFSDVKGQKNAKRAALIAASGFHNIILEGSPGSGKSMIAKRMQGILPPMSLEEILQNAKLNTWNHEKIELTPLRNFKSPHQSASKASIIGSALQKDPKPGEIALAHLGALFFDELPHFEKSVLEALREPLENNVLALSRVHSKVEYPTSFLFIGAQNPCPCGNLLSVFHECRCNDSEIAKYKNRLSQPFLDRIDLFVQMAENEQNAKSDVDSKTMQEQVFVAFIQQKERGQKRLNGKMSDQEIEEFCQMDQEARDLLMHAKDRFGLSMRALNKTKKVSRTIADLARSKVIQKSHVLEAISYRKI
ncbi:YifB family Mg chelatase-like AAA ATPase [Helicobacter mustelae]|uniref:Putative Mg-chetalase related protein n=1 Tax=Helicobacter mustelae (strain ATCC 43772 / CCUG 25715 / CIP 103759 / LMG 18044 / NCTC 12198 / R85-136P) TaxID=679897 RepID=D3UIF4_HELM1|nr:YifB family Mg chelatase-like AAA ATPase [Helicobacter mustelae]CBG40277.1 Putative Mg-chetalase related protein [Helicobacter mustelae 12198]SQH71777.1 Mg-chetalase related protein [Helicobacter mustelae]